MDFSSRADELYAQALHAVPAAQGLPGALLLAIGLASVLAAGLFALYIAGALLSRVQVGRLTQSDARLHRDELGGGERSASRIYEGVLWFGSIFFYLSVPLMIGLAVLAGRQAFESGSFWAGLLTVALGLSVLHVLVAMVSSGGAAAGGILLDERDQPRLFAMLREVADVSQSRMVDRVYLVPGPELSVLEEGGGLRVLFGGGVRALRLGFGALPGLNASQLKAVLAHEYGHFSHGETRLTPVVYRVLQTLSRVCSPAPGKSALSVVNPFTLYLSLYFKLMLGICMGHSRRCELLADRVASLAYGGRTFGSALATVIEASDVYGRCAINLTVRFRQFGRQVGDLFRALEAVREASSDAVRSRKMRTLLERKPGPLDTHPPPQERISRAGRIPGVRPRNSMPARDLLRGADELGARFTAAVVRDVDLYLNQQQAYCALERPNLPGQLEAISAAIGLHEDSRELKEARHPDADELLDQALERLTAAVGPDDPMLVPLLRDLAARHDAAADTAGAAALNERAEALLRAGLEAVKPRVAPENVPVTIDQGAEFGEAMVDAYAEPEVPAYAVPAQAEAEAERAYAEPEVPQEPAPAEVDAATEAPPAAA